MKQDKAPERKGVKKRFEAYMEKIIPGVVKTLEKEYGFHSEDLINSLVASVVNKKMLPNGKTRLENFTEVMYDLRDKIGVEGITELNREFGIIHFDRYGVDRMVRQYEYLKEKRTNPSINHGEFASVFYPYSDSDDAFLEEATLNKYEEFQTGSFNKGRKVLYYEDGSAEQLGKNLLNSRRIFGKYSSIMIGGHGAQVTRNRYPKYVNSVLTPFNDARFVELEIEEVKKIFHLLKEAKKFFTEGGYIVIDSCFAGKTNFGSLILDISSQIDIPIIAPFNLSDADSIQFGRKIFRYMNRLIPEVIFGKSLTSYMLNGKVILPHKMEDVTQKM